MASQSVAADLTSAATGDCAWRPTQYKSIYMRQHRYSVRVRGAYHGSFGTLAEALNTLESLGEDVVQDRSKREDIKNYLERAKIYFEWVASSHVFVWCVCVSVERPRDLNSITFGGCICKMSGSCHKTQPVIKRCDQII